MRSPTSCWEQDFFLYLGRHVGLPVALEGALKLKEISYISTDAYAAGEMKHGPIALLGEGTPVVTIATDSPVLDKVISNMQEVRARGAHVIAVATGDGAKVAAHADQVLTGPAHGLDAAAAAGRHPAAAARLPDRAPARAQRRPAAQPGQDRHGRVAPRGSVTRRVIGLDLLEIDRLEQALARRPALADRLFTDAERAYAATTGPPRAATSRRASAPRRR